MPLLSIDDLFLTVVCVSLLCVLVSSILLCASAQHQSHYLNSFSTTSFSRQSVVRVTDLPTNGDRLFNSCTSLISMESATTVGGVRSGAVC
jgi:hypothetical protein